MKLPKPPETSTDDKKPKSTWDTIVTSTPVVMAVLATILAGLSASEGSQSQYYRSLAAQNQSKAGDQWGFFQAKKLRSANSGGNVELLQNLMDVSALNPDSFPAVAAQMIAKLEAVGTTADVLAKLKAEIGRHIAGASQAIVVMTAVLPPAPELTLSDTGIRQAYEALKKNGGESVPPSLFGSVSDTALHDALRAADQSARADDIVLQPATEAIKQLQTSIGGLSALAATVRRPTTQSSLEASLSGAFDRRSPDDIRRLAADFSAAKLRFDVARYDRESKLNQQTAYLYEIAVRKAGWQSDRSRIRSRYFFYGMLGAQAAVTIATLSLAVRERSWMWSVAAAIGLMAVSYAGYVYVFT